MGSNELIFIHTVQIVSAILFFSLIGFGAYYWYNLGNKTSPTKKIK